MMMLAKLVLTTILTSISSGQSCNLVQYHLKDHGCVDCPLCGNGMGASEQCLHTSFIHDTRITCVECRNGTFSAGYSYAQCDNCTPPCDGKSLLVEVQACREFQDRKCECQYGYGKSGGSGQCLPCCLCDEGGVFQKGCENMPIKFKCSKRNGHCNSPTPPPSSSGSTTQGLASTGTIETTTKLFTTTIQSTKATTSTNQLHHFTNYASVIISVVVMIAIILLALVFKEKLLNCWRRNQHVRPPEEPADIPLIPLDVRPPEEPADIPLIPLDVRPPEEPADIPLIPLGPRWASFKDGSETTEYQCKFCDQNFAEDKLRDINRRRLEDKFISVGPDERKKQLNSLACHFSLIDNFPEDFNKLMIAVGSKHPALKVSSFVKALELIERNDVVEELHEILHVESR